MIRVLPRIAIRASSLAFVLALATTFGCDDGGNDEAMDETNGAEGDGDGDGDSDASGDGDGDQVLGYAADIQPIWDDNCVSACHEPGGVGDATLLLNGNAYANLVEVSSTQAPGLSIVEPGNAADSYLIAKLRGTQASAGGLGGSMPSGPGADPLPEATIALIESWIDMGAAP